MRGPMRFPGPFPGDQRFPFPNEGQVPRGPIPGDPNLRHPGPRYVLHHYTLHQENTIFKLIGNKPLGLYVILSF